MKKLIILLILMSLLGLLIACNGDSNSQAEFSFDADGSYTGFNNIPNDYTMDDAKNDGCVVRYAVETVENQKVWDRFVTTAGRGKDSGIRIAYFIDDIVNPYIMDLFYNDGAYYFFDSSAESLKKQPFEYLLILQGQFGMPVQDSSIVVLTDDNSLTFDLVMKSMLSSSTDFKNSVSEYKLILFQ